MQYYYLMIRSKFKRSYFIVAVVFVCIGLTYIVITAYKSHENSILGVDTEMGSHTTLYEDVTAKGSQYISDVPNPIQSIQMEGLLSKDILYINSKDSLQDMQKVKYLCLAYKISSEKHYWDACKNFILSWTATTISEGNPINDAQLYPLIDSIMIVKNDLTSDDRYQVNTWATSVAFQHLTKPLQGGNEKNNWASHRILILGSLAHIIEDPGLILYAQERYYSHIENSLRASGESFDFETRDSLSYHCYGLEPLLKFAIYEKLYDDKDITTFVSKNGSSLRASVEFVLPYMRGQRQHFEFTNSQVAFDKKRSDNGEKGYSIGTKFHPSGCTRTLEYYYFLTSNPEILMDINSLLQLNPGYLSETLSILQAGFPT